MQISFSYLTHQTKKYYSGFSWFFLSPARQILGHYPKLSHILQNYEFQTHHSLIILQFQALHHWDSDSCQNLPQNEVFIVLAKQGQA
jgi:hypothetical protein